VFEVIQKGGPIMWPIIGCSVIAFAILIERLYHLYRAEIDTEKFMQAILNSVKQNKIIEAISLCDRTPGPVASTIKAGLLKHDRDREEIKEAIEDASIYELPRLEKNLSALATIAHICPLLGLLGTVAGMIRCFQIIQQKATALHPVSPGDLAGGIWEALLTTAAGLVIAIPTFVAYNYLVSRVNNFVLEMETAATNLVNLLIRKKEEEL
jgi:biopolymer transport protein ExbB